MQKVMFMPYVKEDHKSKRTGRKIDSGCPFCSAGCDDIVYHNSGPIVKIRCSKCGFVCDEQNALDNGFKDIIGYWNHIS